MTIKNNALSDKLNEIKNKDKNLVNSNVEEKISEHNSIIDALNSIIIIFTFLLKSLIFGYSLKILFNAPWTFVGFLCIGLSINILFGYLNDLIH